MTNELICFLEAATPGDWFSCINIAGQNMTALITFYALVFVICVGSSLGIGISKGMLAGGIISILMAIGFFLLGAISIVNVFFPILITLTGLVLSLAEVKMST